MRSVRTNGSLSCWRRPAQPLVKSSFIWWLLSWVWVSAVLENGMVCGWDARGERYTHTIFDSEGCWAKRAGTVGGTTASCPLLCLSLPPQCPSPWRNEIQLGLGLVHSPEASADVWFKHRVLSSSIGSLAVGRPLRSLPFTGYLVFAKHLYSSQQPYEIEHLSFRSKKWLEFNCLTQSNDWLTFIAKVISSSDIMSI